VLRIAEHWQASDLGRQRQGNEDNYFVRAPLFVVADGMGGAQAGEVASEMAVASFDPGLPEGGTAAEGLVRVIEEANRRIHDRSREDADRAGMGTTVTAAHVGEGEVTIAHVGDSRAYVLRDGELVRLTRDHSLVGELVARGKLTEEQAEAHPQRSVITRALGPEPRVEVDVETFPARAGDVFLLCSDGLTSMVAEARLQPILGRARSLEEAGRELIDAANDAGGRDNITVILFRLEEVGGDAHGAAAADEPETSEQPSAVGAATEVHTRVRDEEALDSSEVRAAAGASDAAEAEYRRSGTVALDPVRRRSAPEPEEHPPRGAGEPRGAARAPRRRRIPVGLIAVLVLLIIVAGGFWTASRIVYFVGTDPQHGDAITIYQGLPYELPLGVRLYTRHAASGVTLAEVPPARRRTFTEHKLRSLDDAENLVNALENGRIEP
jgi:protein phosphatase